jgi:hypothetical protein
MFAAAAVARLAESVTGIETTDIAAPSEPVVAVAAEAVDALVSAELDSLPLRPHAIATTTTINATQRRMVPASWSGRSLPVSLSDFHSLLSFLPHRMGLAIRLEATETEGLLCELIARSAGSSDLLSMPFDVHLNANVDGPAREIEIPRPCHRYLRRTASLLILQAWESSAPVAKLDERRSQG